MPNIDTNFERLMMKLLYFQNNLLKFSKRKSRRAMALSAPGRKKKKYKDKSRERYVMSGRKARKEAGKK